MLKVNRLIALFLLFITTLFLAAEDPPPFPTASDAVQADLWAAFSNRLDSQKERRSITFDLFTPELDHAFLTPDGKTAVLWIKLRDDHGEILASEPGLVLAVRIEEEWHILLPRDPGWEETILKLPDGMLPAELAAHPQTQQTDELKGALTGYYLPYVAGTSRWLEGSISHFQSIPELGYPSCSETYCRYAYDFTDSDHYPLVAAKDGIVFGSRDSCSDGNPYCTNYIVLRESGNQVYQIYLHLAHGTIPDKLTPGTSVKRGQYLGDTDDTGYSTSQHVHFMVASSIWLGGDGYYWGRSIDIRFADVHINNGIPRTCYEVTHFPIYDAATQCLGDKSDPRNPANDWFASGNVGAYPPTGSISVPAAGATVAIGDSPIIDIRANASDDVRVKAVQLVIQQNGVWIEVGPKISQTIAPGVYDWDVNLCQVGPFNGEIDVAIRILDHEGNITQTVARTITVDHACPPPISQLKPATSFDSSAVFLSWDAQSNGAALDSFELQWRPSSGNWDPSNILTINGNQRSAWFVGQTGLQYQFRLRAVDSNGQVEAWPDGDTPETQASIPDTCLPDGFEPDDDVSAARLLNPGEKPQHNLCTAENNDWFRAELTQNQYYLFFATSDLGGAAVKLSLFSADGLTLISQASASSIGKDTALLIRPQQSGTYTLKVEPLTQNLFGTEALYSINFTKVTPIFLPWVTK